MRYKILVGLFLFIFSWSVVAEDIILDDIQVEGNTVSAVIHKISDPDLVQLYLDQKLSQFDIDVTREQLIFMLLIDNSGSINLKDFIEIRNRVNYFINNLTDQDYLQVYKVNDSREIIYSLDHPDKTVLPATVSDLVREGTLSKIYDSIIDAN